MSNITNNLKGTLNPINVNTIKNILSIQNEITKFRSNYKNMSEPTRNLHANSLYKKGNNNILLIDSNPIIYNINSNHLNTPYSKNIIINLLPEKKRYCTNSKKNRAINRRNLNKVIKKGSTSINYNTNIKLFESIMESNCDSTTINNNETYSDYYNSELNEFKKISKNKKSEIKKIIKSHTKHYSDIVNSGILSKSNKKNIIKDKNKYKRKKSNKIINIKKVIKTNKNIKIIKNKYNKRINSNINAKLSIDRNNILIDIKNHELSIVDSLNRIYYNNEHNENLLNLKINDIILGKLKNINTNRNKINCFDKISFIENFNSDYSFENDYFKENYSGAKISKYNNIENLSFNILTTNQESFNEQNQKASKKKEIIEKKINNFKKTNKNLIFNIESIIDNNIINHNDIQYFKQYYNNWENEIKRNTSENGIYRNQTTNFKKFNKNNIVYNNLNNNKKNLIKNSINNTNSNKSKNNKKKNKLQSNENHYKINNNLDNLKRIYYISNQKAIKKPNRKISINDKTSLSKMNKEDTNEKNICYLSINNIVEKNNNLKNGRNIKFFLTSNSINHLKYSIENKIEPNIYHSLKQSKLKTCSTPKDQKINNFSIKNNSNNNNTKIKNNKFSYISSLNFEPNNINSKPFLKKLQNKSDQKVQKKFFTSEILNNIKKNIKNIKKFINKNNNNRRIKI